jgi:NAD(P)H-hydrate epimerase
VKVVTAAEMREIDRRTIEEFGVPSSDLMERAGSGAAEVLIESGLDSGAKVVILCGNGNNGGDGFVAARHLKTWGAEVSCWVIGERDELSADTLRNLIHAEDSGVRIRAFRPRELDEALQRELQEAAVVIDALLGTGARGRLREPVRRIARLTNAHAKRVVALDLPTGMDADTGSADSDTVRCALTITFGFPKRGMYVLPAREFCGDVVVIDLGYPEDTVGVSTGVLLWNEIGSLLPPRDPRGHKGTFGSVAVVAGSPGMSGAACLSAESALRSGAGLVKLLVPRSVAAICATKLNEVMVYGFADSAEGMFAPESLPEIAPFLAEADAILVGPGIGGADSARQFVRALLSANEKPLVLDADGLNAIGDPKKAVTKRLAKKAAILTPHPGELARLLGKTIEELVKDHVGAARSASASFACEVVFKGAPTVVASPSGAADLCSLGNDGMATAGSGDVLAGLLAGLLAQGLTPETAARVGVMVHSRAGDIARGELGRRGMIAGDILRFVPYAWRELESGPEEEETTPPSDREE